MKLFVTLAVFSVLWTFAAGTSSDALSSGNESEPECKVGVDLDDLLVCKLFDEASLKSYDENKEIKFCACPQATECLKNVKTNKVKCGVFKSNDEEFDNLTDGLLYKEPELKSEPKTDAPTTNNPPQQQQQQEPTESAQGVE